MKATIKEISDIIETKIRPGLIRHGGDLSIIDFQNGTLRIELMGTCRNCPSAHFTIEEIVKTAMNGLVEAVHVINSIDEELLNTARSIIQKKES